MYSWEKWEGISNFPDELVGKRCLAEHCVVAGREPEISVMQIFFGGDGRTVGVVGSMFYFDTEIIKYRCIEDIL